MSETAPGLCQEVSFYIILLPFQVSYKGGQMKKLHRIWLLLFTAGVVMAVDVDITGTVTQSGGGPLGNVTITLKGVSDITATTDSEGKFNLRTPVRVTGMDRSTSMPLDFMIKGREIVFNSLIEKINGNVSIFTGNGAMIVSRDFSDLSSPNRHLTLPAPASGLSFLRVSVNRKTCTVPIVRIGSNVYLKKSPSTSGMQLHLSKSMADSIIDTLIAVKSGYADKKTPVKSYNLSGLSITMDSVRNCSAATLKEAGACGSHNVLIGTAVSSGKLTSLAAREFNYVTAENEMKWQNTEPVEGSFTFSSADAIVNWAQQNGIKVKGHCLVWHNQIPSWVSQARGRDRVLGIMKNHIEKVMGHFGSKVYAWDVVNEAFVGDNDAGEGTVHMRNSVFYNEIGPDYIKQAFTIARNYADNNNMKDIKLYYNDASLEGDHNKTRFAHQIIREWVDDGAPIDGIGFETHLGPPNNLATAETVKNNLQFYADLGLDVLISEWDINLCGNLISKAEQLALYYEITRVCVDQPRCVAITFWGVNDGDSWLNTFNTSLCNGANSQSLLFSNNQKKDTYTRVLNALNGK